MLNKVSYYVNLSICSNLFVIALFCHLLRDPTVTQHVIGIKPGYQVPRSQVLTEYKESKIPGPVAYVIHLKVKGTSPFVFLSELAKQSDIENTFYIFLN